MTFPRRPARFPSPPPSSRISRTPMAFRSVPKVHPWTHSPSRALLSREQIKALDEARQYIHRFDGLPASLRSSAEFWDFVLLSPVLSALLLAERGVRALLRKIIRDARQRETASSPSLRGTPVKEDIDSAWNRVPRTMLDALRIGSRLLDLEPAVDNTRMWKENPLTGKREVVFRHAGIKGWLREHCPDVQYNTAMRYKKLASRLRTVCGVAGNIPLEWLLPDTTVPAEGLDASTKKSIEKGRAELGRILATAKSLRGLDRVVEERMNLVGLPRKGKRISVISHDGNIAGCKENGKATAVREMASGKGENTPFQGREVPANAPQIRMKGGRGRPKGATVAEGAAKAKRQRLLSAMQHAGMRPEGRLLWLRFRHLLFRAGA